MSHYNRRRLYQGRQTATTDNIKVSRAAWELLEEHDYTAVPETLTGTGSGGNITKRDVANWLAEHHRPNEEEE